MKRLADRPESSGDDAALHPIAVVSDRTGLSQDVLRVWERRYGVVRPVRGTGGQRLYANSDIERLRLLYSATRAGRGISQVAHLSSEALQRMVGEDVAERSVRVDKVRAPESTDAIDIVEVGFAFTRSLDAAPLNDHLRRAAALLGVSTFIESVATPLLRRIGDEWHAGNLTPAQEHLAAAVLHDILVETMRAFPQVNGAPRVLVATPAGDRHAIGAALVGATSAVAGWNVVYLGADLPADEIVAAAVTTSAAMVALSILYVDDRARMLGEVRRIRASLPAQVGLLVGGSGAATMATDITASGVRVGATLADLQNELRRDR